jgi:hypothetical protein
MTDFRALCAELLEIIDFLCEGDSRPDCDIVARARACLSQPEPEGPTDEELNDLWLELYGFHDGPTSGDVAVIARAVLARWGRPAVEPVPVSERLPGPEDCMDEGWAWFYTPRGNWIKAVLPVSPAYTHWLPHYALPTPQP